MSIAKIFVLDGCRSRPKRATKAPFLWENEKNPNHEFRANLPIPNLNDRQLISNGWLHHRSADPEVDGSRSLRMMV